MCLRGYYRLIDTEREVVTVGDVVNINCIVYNDNKVLDVISDLDVLVGSYNFNKEAEDGIVDHNVGDTVVLSIDQDMFEITINKIKEFVAPELTKDFFVQNYGVSTYDEFILLMKKRVYEQQYIIQKLSAQAGILDQIIERSLFIVKESDVKVYFQDTVQYYQDVSKLYNMTFEKYIKKYHNMNVETFTDKCYDESCRDLKGDLIIERIWKKMSCEEKKEMMVLCGVDIESFESVSKESIRMMVLEYLFNLAVTH